MHPGVRTTTLIVLMREHPEQGEGPVIKPEPLGKAGFVLELVKGTGVMLGLALLWLLESARNVFFRILDRLNVKPGSRRASAFPPGRPRRRPVA